MSLTIVPCFITHHRVYLLPHWKRACPSLFSHRYHQSPTHIRFYGNSLIAQLSIHMPPAVFPGQELLAFDEDRLVWFLNDYRTYENNLDISRVSGLDAFSEDQRGEFSKKLR
jgi:hypothetical protein